MAILLMENWDIFWKVTRILQPKEGWVGLLPYHFKMSNYAVSESKERKKIIFEFNDSTNYCSVHCIWNHLGLCS